MLPDAKLIGHAINSEFLSLLVISAARKNKSRLYGLRDFNKNKSSGLLNKSDLELERTIWAKLNQALQFKGPI